MRNNNPFENSSHHIPDNPFEYSHNNIFTAQKIDTFSVKDMSFEDNTEVKVVKENKKPFIKIPTTTSELNNTYKSINTEKSNKSMIGIIIGIILIINTIAGGIITFLDDNIDLENNLDINNEYQLSANEKTILFNCIQDIQNNNTSFDISKIPSSINWKKLSEDLDNNCNIYDSDYSYKILSIYDWPEDEDNNFYKLLFILEDNKIRGFKIIEKDNEYNIINTWDVGNTKLDSNDDIAYYE